MTSDIASLASPHLDVASGPQWHPGSRHHSGSWGNGLTSRRDHGWRATDRGLRRTLTNVGGAIPTRRGRTGNWSRRRGSNRGGGGLTRRPVAVRVVRDVRPRPRDHSTCDGIVPLVLQPGRYGGIVTVLQVPAPRGDDLGIVLDGRVPAGEWSSASVPVDAHRMYPHLGHLKVPTGDFASQSPQVRNGVTGAGAGTGFGFLGVMVPPFRFSQYSPPPVASRGTVMP